MPGPPDQPETKCFQHCKGQIQSASLSFDNSTIKKWGAQGQLVYSHQVFKSYTLLEVTAVENEALPYHTALPISGTRLQAVWKGKLAPCCQSRLCAQSRWWQLSSAAPSPQHSSGQTSQVSFSRVAEDGKAKLIQLSSFSFDFRECSDNINEDRKSAVQQQVTLAPDNRVCCTSIC